MKVSIENLGVTVPFPINSNIDLSEKPICVLSSPRASSRRMRAQLAQPVAIAKQNPSPTERFMQAHPVNEIYAALRSFGMNGKDRSLFKEMIANEVAGFIGYHAGSSTVRLFQDMIAILVKDVLQIPIKDDFVFMRIPGDSTFHYEKASDFLNDMHTNIPAKYWDTQPDVRQHILSMNMNLYQSYDWPGNLTPRYFLENMTWTDANVRDIIKPFFSSLGIDSKTVDRIWSEALDLLPHDRGYILQFFDRSENFAFTQEHAYIAQSGGRPHPAHPGYKILFDKNATSFPQIRLVLGNESTLNPFSDLEIKRYDGMTAKERSAYENSLRDLLKNLGYDKEKVEIARERLVDLWGI